MILVTYGTTAASSTDEWLSNMASNSAGATCMCPKLHFLKYEYQCILKV